MLLRKRKPALSEAAKASSPAQTRARGLAGAAAELGGSGPPASATPAAAAKLSLEPTQGVGAASDETPPGSSQKRSRKAPVDIGIELLLGGDLSTAELHRAASALDRLPLGTAGFSRETLQSGCDYLRKADPKLVPLIEQHGPPERLLSKDGSNFATLAKAIVFQQLGTHAAAAIYGRVLTACGCSHVLSPPAVLAAPVAALRQAGLSERKVSYIADLAHHFNDGRLSDAKIAAMDEAELEAALCAIRGIGKWTVQMHAMFHLGSPDVLPCGDLGVQRGMMALYNLKELPDEAAMHRIAEAWRPFASLGSYYMWKVDTSTVNSKPKKAKKGTWGC